MADDRGSSDSTNQALASDVSMQMSSDAVERARDDVVLAFDRRAWLDLG
jgi:hypothetical protein